MSKKRTCFKVTVLALAASVIAACSSSSVPTEDETPSAAVPTAVETEYLPEISGLSAIAEARMQTAPADVVSDGKYIIALNPDIKAGTTTLTAVVSKSVAPSKLRNWKNSEERSASPSAPSSYPSATASQSAQAEDPATHESASGKETLQKETRAEAIPGKSTRVAWSAKVEGLVKCEGPSPIVCESSTYSQGKYTADKVYLVDTATGEMEDLRLGRPGTFISLGVHNSVAYFLTWNGTRDIHLTGFDKDGAPVADRNLRISSTKAKEVRGQIAGNFIAIQAQEGGGIYSIDNDVYAQASIQGACIGLRDGVICEGEEKIIGIGVSSRWEIETTLSIGRNSAQAKTSLDEAKEMIEGQEHHGKNSGDIDDSTSAAAPANTAVSASPATSASTQENTSKSDTSQGTDASKESSAKEKSYISVMPQDLGIIRTTEDSIILPSGASIVLGAGTKLANLDFSRPVGVATVRYLGAEAVGESASEYVSSTVLFTEEGEIMYRLDHSGLAQHKTTLEPGQSGVSSAAKWQGDTLAFYENSENFSIGAYIVKAGA